MPRGVYDRKQKDELMKSQGMSPSAINDSARAMMASVEKTLTAPEQPSEKMFPVLLNKNYVPSGAYEIVGYLKEAVKSKDAAGNWRIVEPEEFVRGVMKPHTSHGVGFGEMKDKTGEVVTNAKIWAGTKIKLPVSEAKTVIAKKIADRADDLAA